MSPSPALLPHLLRLVSPFTFVLLCACAHVAPEGPLNASSDGPRAMVARLRSQAMPARLLVAGDIGECNAERKPRDPARATGALLDDRPGLVLAAGDLAYPDGQPADFADCFDPAWGMVRARLLPAPGNHEYHTKEASGYFRYFGQQAGTPGAGWYSVDFAGWHIIALNSNLPLDAASVQIDWLRRDLAARPRGCLLAFWHHPRFSSGEHGDNAFIEPAWRMLTAAGADIVVNGHDHEYERFAPQDADGHAGAAGIREFVVGTGGAGLTRFAQVRANSEVRNGNTYGILEINLGASSYDWRFLGTDRAEFEDRGSGQCHQAGA
ncbi:MAG: metallophosphoesterase [Pseudomonadota bacterium]|nr:metallophosphoesterase [Pseudomonadota bacterium]